MVSGISKLIFFIISFNQRVINKLTRCFWNNYSKLYLKSKDVSFYWKDVFFQGKVFWQIDNGKILLGKCFRCNSGVKYGITSNMSKIVIKEGAILKIGDYSGMTNTIIHCHKSITIGSYVNIGAGCIIFDTNFHCVNWQDRLDVSYDVKNAVKKNVVIGDHVFIGTNSIITKGVEIGDNSVIAAGSVVVSNIPPNQIWGGNPAVFIKNI